MHFKFRFFQEVGINFLGLFSSKWSIFEIVNHGLMAINLSRDENFAKFVK